jgi:GT2 family glycosyltransferase
MTRSAPSDPGLRELSGLGTVVIGRNEGARLERCLRAVIGRVPVVYVDSGSEDNSVQLARDLGAEVLELDASLPFTAARARNAGWRLVKRQHPHLEHVQFLDGDCELQPAWLARGLEVLTLHLDVAAVCGRVRERHRATSVYNRLCDMEWDRPAGETLACGGNAMFRFTALGESGGFDSELIAGEEPDLCFRLRQRGWRILRVDAEMVLHDAAQTRFSQWWRRAVRSGYGYAERAWRYGTTPERYGVRECLSIWLWGFWVPFFAFGYAGPTWGLSLVLLVAYPAHAARIYQSQRRLDRSRGDSLIYASFCVLSKFPQLQGQLRFTLGRLLRRRSEVIEHRQA